MQHLSLSLAVLTLLAIAPLSGCDDAAPKNPTWIADVQPQVEGNCIRCHSYPSRGGAPDSFRLDVFKSTYLIDRTEIRGAEVMAEFMSQRAGVEGSMPPDFSRGDHMRGTFENWFKDITKLPNRGSGANNRAPMATLLSELPIFDKEMVKVSYEVKDPDGDIVYGRFTVNGIEVADALHSGRGSFAFYSGTFPEGDHEIIAEMSDGRSAGETTDSRGFVSGFSTNQVIGTLRVRHADGNVAPTVRIVRRVPGNPTDLNDLPNSILRDEFLRDVLVADVEGPLGLRVYVEDPDGGSHTVSIVAFRGSEEIVVVSNLALTGDVDLSWDTTAVSEGPGWRLRVTATDAQGGSHTINSGRIYVSHHVSTETFDSVRSIFNSSCGLCHQRAPKSTSPDVDPEAIGRVPYFNFTLANAKPINPAPCTQPDPDDLIACTEENLAYEFVHNKIAYNTGNLYRRLMEVRNMPPKSANRLFSLSNDPVEILSDEDRARLADYLLGGSPR